MIARRRAARPVIRLGALAIAAGCVYLAVAACGDAARDEAVRAAEQRWVGEGVDTAPTAWWWAVEQTGAQVTALLSEHQARLTSIQVTNGTSPPLFTVTMVPNTGTYQKRWWWFPDVTLTQLLRNALILDARVVNMDSFVVGGETHHAAILISNTGVDVTQWWITDDLDGADFGAFIGARSARLVDWRQYTKGGATLNAGVMVTNTGAGYTPWWFYPGLTDAEVHGRLTAHDAMLVSLQVADPVAGTFNVIMDQDAGFGPVSWWWNKDDAQIHALVNGDTMRMVDLKSYDLGGTRLYATITAPNVSYSAAEAGEAACDATVLAGWRAAPPAVGLASQATAQAFDAQVLAFMQQYGLPGGAVGVVRNGKLVLARGYGFADQPGAQIAHPDNLFRLASLSKGITAAAILVAQQQGLLSLDGTYPFRILGLSPNPAATSLSPVPSQLASITVRQLLNHAGGFSRECGCTISIPSGAPPGDQPLHGTSCGSTCDPMAADLFAIRDLPGNSMPPTCDQIIQYMLTQPLIWTPGTVMDYSNFGYCVLEATLEAVTGTSYASWVAANVLAPAGASNGVIPGGTTFVADHEVSYYELPDNYPMQSIYDTQGLCQNAGTPSASTFCVPIPYGGVGPTSTGDILAALAEGGWIATAVDLLRLEVALDGRDGDPPILTAASIADLEANPNLWTETSAGAGVISLTPPSSSFWYGFGFNVEPNGSWQDVGGFNGTVTHEYRGGTDASTDPAAGFGWVALFNGTPDDPHNTVGSQIGAMMTSAFNTAGGASAAWLATDLFDQYGTYTSWMPDAQYQAYFTTQTASGLYPSRVEGKNLAGIPMFRAFFAPFHGNDWSSHHDMDCLTYQGHAASMASSGYATASLQSFVGDDGLRRYQATWVKW